MLCNTHKLQEGATPLWIASHNGYQKVVETLLSAKANPDLPKTVRTINVVRKTTIENYIWSM